MARFVTLSFIFMLACFGFTGCMMTGGLIIQPEPIIIGDPPPNHDYRTKRGNKHYKKKKFKVPPGHMPPRGQCRVWYFDRPPGHQPTPVSCYRIRQVPYGATVIRG